MLDTIIQIIQALPDGLFTSIVTNGVLLDENKIDLLMANKLSRLKISYDTTDKTMLPILRNGAQREHLKTIENNIDYAAKRGMLVYLRTALGRLNAIDLNNIYLKAKNLGASVLQIKPIVISGRANDHKDDLSLTPEQLMECFSKLSQIYDPDKTEISISCFPPARLYGLPVKNCANHSKFYLNTDGNIYICNYCMNQSVIMGNYLEENGTLKALIKRREIYDNIFNSYGVISECASRDNYTQFLDNYSLPDLINKNGARRIPEQYSNISCNNIAHAINIG